MENTSNKDSFLKSLEDINIKNSILIGTNQIIKDSLENYADLKKIISINFENCVGIFCHSDQKFLFLHSDPNNFGKALKEISQFFKEHIGKSINTLCFYNDKASNCDERDKVLEVLEKFSSKTNSKNVFKPIKVKSYGYDNKVPVFDLFLDISPIKEGGEPSYHHLQFDSQFEIDPYKPNNIDARGRSNPNNLKTLFYLDNEEHPIQIENSRNYLKSFIDQARDKSPGRISEGMFGSYAGNNNIKDISEFKLDSQNKSAMRKYGGRILCELIERSEYKIVEDWCEMVEDTYESYKRALELGADPNQANSNGDLPLQILIKQDIPIWQFKDFIDLLLRYDVNVNQKNQTTGETALSIAIDKGDKELVRILLDIEKKEQNNSFYPKSGTKLSSKENNCIII